MADVCRRLYTHFHLCSCIYETTKCNNQETKATNCRLVYSFSLPSLGAFMLLCFFFFFFSSHWSFEMQKKQEQPASISFPIETFHLGREQSLGKIVYEWKLWYMFILKVLFWFCFSLFQFNSNDSFMLTALHCTPFILIVDRKQWIFGSLCLMVSIYTEMKCK